MDWLPIYDKIDIEPTKDSVTLFCRECETDLRDATGKLVSIGFKSLANVAAFIQQHFEEEHSDILAKEGL